MKGKTKIKKEIDWSELTSLVFIGWILGFLLNFFMGLFLIVCSFIPLLNIYVFDRFCKDDQERLDTPNILSKAIFKNVKYKLVKREKVIEEVWERV